MCRYISISVVCFCFFHFVLLVMIITISPSTGCLITELKSVSSCLVLEIRIVHISCSTFINFHPCMVYHTATGSRHVSVYISCIVTKTFCQLIECCCIRSVLRDWAVMTSVRRVVVLVADLCGSELVMYVHDHMRLIIVS